MNIFPIVFACDSGYLDQTSVALFTMCKYCTSPNVLYKIYYLHNDFSISDKEHLLNVVKFSQNLQVSLEFIKLENFDANEFYLEQGTYITLSTYYRLIIPIIFKNYDSILYVDSDMIFLKDPYDLTHIDMGNKVIAGVSDRWIEHLVVTRNKPVIKYLKKDLKIKNYKNYINAGVIFFNLKQIRKLHAEYDFLKSRTKISKAMFQDQCCINYTANRLGGIYLLEHSFNIKYENEIWVKDVTGITKASHIQELIEQDYIGSQLLLDIPKYINSLPNINRFIHYLSKRKPWNYRPDYVNQVWWGAVFALPNTQHYIDNYSAGFDEKYVPIYQYIANHYFS